MCLINKINDLRLYFDLVLPAFKSISNLLPDHFDVIRPDTAVEADWDPAEVFKAVQPRRDPAGSERADDDNRAAGPRAPRSDSASPTKTARR